jgi:hypothetical protein
MKLEKWGVQINLTDIEIESQRSMSANNFAAFNVALGAAPDADPIETARSAVEAHEPAEIEAAIRQNSIGQSAWVNGFEDWELKSVECDCSWSGKLGEAVFDADTETVSFLRCPSCDARVALMGNQATTANIEEIAASGSQKAAEYLAKIAKTRNDISE